MILVSKVDSGHIT